MTKLNIIKMFARSSNGPILDIGACGGIQHMDKIDCVHMALRANTKHEVVGLEVNPEAARAMRERGCNIVIGDVSLTPAFGKFDLVFAGESIEHVPNQDSFFRFCVESLAPGGSIVITTPNPKSLPSILHHFILGEDVKTPEHVLWHSLNTLRNLGRLYGLRVCRMWYVYDWSTLPGKTLRQTMHRFIYVLGILFPRGAMGMVIEFKKARG